MPLVHLDDKFAQSDAQLADLTIVLADESLLTINTIKHITHNTIRNTL